MELSPKDRLLVRKMVALLERKRGRNELQSRDVSSADLHELLASHNPDLNALGLTLLDLLPPRRTSAHAKSERAVESIGHQQFARHLAAYKGDRPHVRPQWLSARFSEQFNFLISSRPKQEDVPPKPWQESMTIIVHGTFAATTTWWRQGAPFWTHIDGLTGTAYRGDDPFFWSGDNNDTARCIAATALVQWVANHPCDNLDAVAHSHGGNVCFLASRMGVKFRRLVTLGTPIRTEYLPNLKVIGQLHNVFSTSDFIQTPGGTFPNCRGEGRTLGDCGQITNHRASDDGMGTGSPGHSDLHEPVTWRANGLDATLT